MLHDDDLIDDRALSDDGEDAFRLRDVVDEVAELCESVAVPATLAVYGSWGSGKSSLANLLKARFEANPRIAFPTSEARVVTHPGRGAVHEGYRTRPA
jgi:hypothetical protein